MFIYLLLEITALHALISSLSPTDAPDSTKLDDEQASKLSERLDQILGAPGDGGQERRNEKGEVRCLLRIHAACLLRGS